MKTGPFRGPCFCAESRQIPAICCQNVAEYGKNRRFSAPDFMRTAEEVASDEWRVAARLGHHLPLGWRICMVTGMVQQREVTSGISRNFHHPLPDFCVNPLLQTNGLVGSLSVFGHFFAYQILPSFTKFYQIRPKVCSEGPQTGTLRGVFLDRFI